MIPLSHVSRLTSLINGTKNFIHGRVSVINTTQIGCYASRKTAEDVLGITKPKRPLTPFFKFMTQMRPALLAKNPGLSSKEAVTWTSKHWHQLDAETKSQMAKEYYKDIEDYKKIKAVYKSSLTDSQKEDIARVRGEMAMAKEKRKLKAEYRELGRPRKPMSSYLLFCQTKRDQMNQKNFKEYQEQMKNEWMILPSSEKQKYDNKAQELMKKFKKELEKWELKMISIGRSDLVTTKTLRETKLKTEKSNK